MIDQDELSQQQRADASKERSRVVIDQMVSTTCGR